MISLVRVDNRLIHGQVVEAWFPHLGVGRVVVADDESARSPLVRAAMGLAVPSTVEVRILPLSEVPFEALRTDDIRTLLLFRDVVGLVEAQERGLVPGHVNLGNVHYGSGRRQVSPSVFLSPDELRQLKMLTDEGARVEARGVPADRPVEYPEIAERFNKGG